MYITMRGYLIGSMVEGNGICGVFVLLAYISRPRMWHQKGKGNGKGIDDN